MSFSYAPTLDEFEALLNDATVANPPIEGAVVRGTITSITRDRVIIDIGLKTEGTVDLKEFEVAGRVADIKVGDAVDVYVERIENARGEAVLSRDKARREEAWQVLERAFEQGEKVEGTVFSRVKGGFTVDLGGAVAFLPGSQVDVRPLRDLGEIMNMPQRFAILKMDHRRGNIVVSRRAVLEESRAEQRAEIVGTLREGAIIEGVVKNITDYGAFVDLGGVDGLLHVTDISWKRVGHPSEVLNVGQSVTVQLIKVSVENQRISLGMKQLERDPWSDAAELLKIGNRVDGRVTNVADYGAFVEIADGVEGLVHISEMSWTKKNIHPDKLVTVGAPVQVQVLEVDHQKRRISLGLKQCLSNPWKEFADTHPVGTIIEGEVRNVTEFGVFVALGADIDGMIHLSDLSREVPGEEAIKGYEKGQVVKARVLETDPERERVALGIKQMEDDVATLLPGPKKGEVLNVTISAITENGLEVQTSAGLAGLIRKNDISRDKNEQKFDSFTVGQTLEAKVSGIDKNTKAVLLSIKALEANAEDGAEGGSFGALLGQALRQQS